LLTIIFLVSYSTVSALVSFVGVAVAVAVAIPAASAVTMSAAAAAVTSVATMK